MNEYVVDLAPPAADRGWQRVHPATPFLRWWQALAVAAVFFGQDAGESILTGNGLGDGVTADLAHNRLIGAAIGVAVLAAVGLWAYVSWRCIRYRVSGDQLELHHGVLSRQHRQAPLDRLQAVDITEPLVARLFGFAKLTLEVAGAGDSKIEIAYLTMGEARQLRNHLLATAAGLRSEAAAPPQVGEAPEHHVLTVPAGRLIGSILLSGVSLWLVAVIAVVVASIVATDEATFAFALLPTFLTFGSIMWKQLAFEFGFRVASAPDGVRIRHGLLEQRTQTVPPGRVQAVRVHQSVLWRMVGWWAVEVNVAGYGGGRDNQGTVSNSHLLPVGSLDDALAVLAFVAPSLPIDRTLVTGTGDAAGFTASPSRARWIDPLGWRRHGYRVTDHVLLLRGGRLRRQLDVVPHARTQSCGVWQGPLQRRLGLASFELHSTPGPIQPRVAHLASATAADLLDHQAERARVARGAASDTWLVARPA